MNIEAKERFMNEVRLLVADKVPLDRLDAFLTVPLSYCPAGTMMQGETLLEDLVYGLPLAQTDYDWAGVLQRIEVKAEADVSARSLAYATLHELAHAVRGFVPEDDTGGHDAAWAALCQKWGICASGKGNPNYPNLIVDPVLGMQIDALEYPA